MKRFTILLTLLVGISFLFNGFGFAQELRTRQDRDIVMETEVADEVVIQFKSGIAGELIEKLMSKLSLEKKRDSYKPGRFVVFKKKNAAEKLEKLIEKLGLEGIVKKVEKNYIAQMTMVPNDTYYSGYQWNMTRIGMEAAWDVSTGSGVVVAVIDTGVDQSQADLAGTSFTTGYDFVNSDNDPTDDEGHGTHCAGTIAQTTNNNTGCAGIAYNATIMPVKVLNSSGSGTYTDIADGIEYATDNGADIISLSLGGSSSQSVLQNAINYAWNNGVVVICAAGNDGVSTPFYPAAYTNSISVSATDSADGLASYSNYGSTIDISAPGGDDVDRDSNGYIDGILQNTNGGYYFYYGTSMACPHVAGVAALVKALDTSQTNSEIRNVLETTVEDLGASGWDQYFGYGLVDAYAAVLAVSSTPDTTPPVISSVASSSVTHNSAVITWTTDEPATSVVYYGTTTAYGSTASAAGYVTSHSVNLTGLSANTLYHYKVYSEDPSANDSESGDYTFTTGSQPSQEMFVYNIAMSKSTRYWGWQAMASSTITIRDTDSNPVQNATVYITWSGAASGSSNAVTNSSGQVTFDTSWYWFPGTFTITVNNVTHASIPYNSSLNNETSDSI